MGYSKSKRTIERMKPFLDELLRQGKQNHRWEADNPTRLAYRIREALHAAQKHRQEYLMYANLQPFFQFHTGNGFVEARYLGEGGSSPIDSYKEESRKKRETRRVEIDIPVTSVHGLVGAVMSHEDAEELYFPNAFLDPQGKERLRQWADSTAWNILDHEGEGMTITKKDIEKELEHI